MLVKPASRGGIYKCWPQVVRIDGKVTIIGLERYPVVMLAMAQGKALENVRGTAEGRQHKKKRKENRGG